MSPVVVLDNLSPTGWSDDDGSGPLVTFRVVVLA